MSSGKKVGAVDRRKQESIFSKLLGGIYSFTESESDCKHTLQNKHRRGGKVRRKSEGGVRRKSEGEEGYLEKTKRWN